MGLTFCNSYKTAIATCISFWEPEECGAEGNGWHNIGWYWVEPGACRIVFENGCRRREPLLVLLRRGDRWGDVGRRLSDQCHEQRV